MKNKKLSVRFLTESAVIAALYAAATYLSAAFSLAYGPVQFRLSEALTVLSSLMPVIFNAVIVGLEIVMLTPVEGGKLTAFAISALEVGAGELVVCLVLGLPLYSALRHTKLFK